MNVYLYIVIQYMQENQNLYILMNAYCRQQSSFGKNRNHAIAPKSIAQLSSIYPEGWVARETCRKNMHPGLLQGGRGMCSHKSRPDLKSGKPFFVSCRIEKYPCRRHVFFKNSKNFLFETPVFDVYILWKYRLNIWDRKSCQEKFPVFGSSSFRGAEKISFWGLSETSCPFVLVKMAHIVHFPGRGAWPQALCHAQISGCSHLKLRDLPPGSDHIGKRSSFLQAFR